MYSVGDFVVYGSMGIFKVEAIGVLTIAAIDPTRSYYTLAPLYKDGHIYAPIDTRTFMRPVMSHGDAIKLVRRMPFIDEAVYEPRHLGDLKAHYHALLLSHDCVDLIHLIKSVYVKRRSLAEKGKCLGQVEAEYMKRAEEMLYDELAVALDIPSGDVKGYIEDAVERIERRMSTAVGSGSTFGEVERAC